MRKSVSLVFAAALCVVVLGLSTTTQAEDFNYAKRIALGLQGGSVGFGPTVEYWASDNLDLSAKLSWFFYYSAIGLRGTYLLNNPIHIFGDFSARPYVGAGVGYQSWSALGYTAWGGPGAEVFGGLMQPLTKNITVRAELQASYYILTWPGGYLGSRGFPLGINLGGFYHFGG
jgi:hypothetical protein